MWNSHRFLNKLSEHKRFRFMPIFRSLYLSFSFAACSSTLSSSNTTNSEVFFSLVTFAIHLIHAIEYAFPPSTSFHFWNINLISFQFYSARKDMMSASSSRQVDKVCAHTNFPLYFLHVKLNSVAFTIYFNLFSLLIYIYIYIYIPFHRKELCEKKNCSFDKGMLLLPTLFSMLSSFYQEFIEHNLWTMERGEWYY